MTTATAVFRAAVEYEDGPQTDSKPQNSTAVLENRSKEMLSLTYPVLPTL